MIHELNIRDGTITARKMAPGVLSVGLPSKNAKQFGLITPTNDIVLTGIGLLKGVAGPAPLQVPPDIDGKYIFGAGAPGLIVPSAGGYFMTNSRDMESFYCRFKFDALLVAPGDAFWAGLSSALQTVFPVPAANSIGIYADDTTPNFQFGYSNAAGVPILVDTGIPVDLAAHVFKMDISLNGARVTFTFDTFVFTEIVVANLPNPIVTIDINVGMIAPTAVTWRLYKVEIITNQ